MGRSSRKKLPNQQATRNVLFGDNADFHVVAPRAPVPPVIKELLKLQSEAQYRREILKVRDDLLIEGEVLEGFCLAGIDLSRQVFSDCQLHRVSFGYPGNLQSSAVLDRVLFRNCQLEDCDLSLSSMNGSAFEGCEISGGSFYKTNLEGSDLSRSGSSSFRDCRFAYSYLQGVNFVGGSFPASHFYQVHFSPGVDFSWTDLSSAMIQKSKLIDARFDHFQGEGFMVDAADFQGSSFRDSSWKTAFVTDSNFQNTSFRGADLSISAWEGINLEKSDFSGANMERMAIRNSNLSGVDFSKARFQQTQFDNCRLTDSLLPDKSGITFTNCSW